MTLETLAAQNQVQIAWDRYGRIWGHTPDGHQRLLGHTHREATETLNLILGNAKPLPCK